MTQNVVGKIPEFTQDASAETKDLEVKQADSPEPVDEKETPAPPAEKPAPEKGEDVKEPTQEDLQKAVAKLQDERTKLLTEIKDLRGTKRTLKEEKLQKVEQHIDELKDLHPEDVNLIDRVLRSKGYVTKEEANVMFYDTVKQEELDKFLNKYPEYKPENDPDNIYWSALERQIEKEKDLGYTLPKNPHNIGVFLERVHQAVSQKTKAQNDGGALQRRVQVAGVGSGGTQPSSSPKRLDSAKRTILERGGWSEDEIKRIEAKLPD